MCARAGRPRQGSNEKDMPVWRPRNLPYPSHGKRAIPGEGAESKGPRVPLHDRCEPPSGAASRPTAARILSAIGMLRPDGDQIRYKTRYSNPKALRCQHMDLQTMA